jgi:hypothetical protein
MKHLQGDFTRTGKRDLHGMVSLEVVLLFQNVMTDRMSAS